ncbi:Membrane protein implicated in regulation of membrane protease activity [Micromonospora yangpuensis]|uniref:Membrane protein implicated in regulation of membrane protease activity n=1 Tax=Micromonospora yangpuensis TaxID=683228 RepID=A0A1C6UXV4_9ACTN|nr:Membrane protein implicated in regulation of membrane protease activity [Micromonospora yangpuensis]
MLWIVLGVVLAVAEIFTATLFLIMFAVGAFAAAGAAALGAPVEVQAVVFAVVSALTTLLARPTIQRHRLSARESGEQPFGIEAIEGSPALVLEQVDVDHGMIKIDGELWSARSYDASQVFAPGERVQVIQVRGATALVWRDDILSPGELPDKTGELRDKTGELPGKTDELPEKKGE